MFWAGMAAGEFINDAAIAAGSYRKQGARWLAAAGGVRPRRGRGLQGRCLTLAQREKIALGRARGDSIRAIAAVLGRSPSTVSRELRRNVDGRGGIGPPPRMPESAGRLAEPRIIPLTNLAGPRMSAVTVLSRVLMP